MADLWGGRFTKDTDQMVYNFNASINFDKKLYKQDLKEECFIGKENVERWYQNKDFHAMYVVEIEKVLSE